MNDKIFRAFAPVRTPFARVREFILSYADDEESRKAIRVLYDMIAHSLNTIAAASGQIAGFFAHGNETIRRNIRESLRECDLFS